MDSLQFTFDLAPDKELPHYNAHNDDNPKPLIDNLTFYVKQKDWSNMQIWQLRNFEFQSVKYESHRIFVIEFIANTYNYLRYSRKLAVLISKGAEPVDKDQRKEVL